jgi:hypothetical protein
LREVPDALEAERFEQRDARRRFAAATADDRMMIERSGALDEVDHDRAADAASV